MKTIGMARTLAVIAGLTLATAVSADHAWNDYHWARSANPLPLKVVDSVTSDWQFEFDEALKEWNISSVLAMSVDSADDSNRTRKQCKTVRGQMRVCNAAYGYNGWLGLATIGLDSNGHIDRGTAKVNDSYSWYWADPNEKRHVMCQEIGHVFGLGHTSVDGSSQQTCMDYSSDPRSVSPNQHDYDLLASMYEHLDGYNSYDDSGSGGGGGDEGGGDNGCNPRSPKCNPSDARVMDGMPPMGVRVHAGKFEEIWVAPRSDGGLWIHHVRLVDEADRYLGGRQVGGDHTH